MTSLYFDSTYLCKLHWPEPGAAEVVACAAGADELVVALHGEAEFYSAGHRKLREGVVSPEALSAVFAQFQADYAGGGIRFLQITEAIVHRVFEVYSSASRQTYLRAADAIHLATAAEHGFAEIYSNDGHLLAAASLFGLRGVNVIP
jgi:predicted nucleic acid-binding protein